MAFDPNISRIKELKPDLYSDFLNNFDKTPFTGELAKVTAEDSIGQSLKNLFLTQLGERFYDHNMGSRIKTLLFELDSDVDLEYGGIVFELEQLARVYEPRAERLNIFVKKETYGIRFTITFRAINIPDQDFTVEFFIKRVR